MILDSVKGFERYTKMHARFEKAYEFMRSSDFSKMEPGEYPIDGKDIYCKVWAGDAKGIEIPKLEVHDTYIDIHVLIEGEETIGHKDRSKCSAEEIVYNDADVIAFFDDAPDNFISMTPGNAVLFFPHDAHAPLIGTGKIKKAVLKIRM